MSSRSLFSTTSTTKDLPTTAEQWEARNKLLIEQFDRDCEEFKAKREKYIKENVDPKHQAGLRLQQQLFESFVGMPVVPTGPTLLAKCIQLTEQSDERARLGIPTPPEYCMATQLQAAIAKLEKEHHGDKCLLNQNLHSNAAYAVAAPHTTHTEKEKYLTEDSKLN